MEKFYVTFGDKYRNEVHPNGGHPDGYYVVMAKDMAEARDKAFMRFGEKWSMISSAKEMKFELFPIGQLGIIE